MLRLLVVVFLVITTAKAELRECKIYGDPHVITFDGAKFDLVNVEGIFRICDGGFGPKQISIVGIATKTDPNHPQNSRLTAVLLFSPWNGQDSSCFMMNTTGLYEMSTIGQPYVLTNSVPAPHKLETTPTSWKLYFYLQDGKNYLYSVLYNKSKQEMVMAVPSYYPPKLRNTFGACGNNNKDKTDESEKISAMGGPKVTAV